MSALAPLGVDLPDQHNLVGEEAERRAAPPASSLPCLFVTTACQDQRPALPGPRKKQAQALTDNIEWMAKTFGPERIGFLTLTLGDVYAGGRFRNLRDRKEAQRRFHSFMTNEISRHYVLGVTVTERHGNGGIHFHLVVVCQEDIRGQIDFAACFPAKDIYGKPSQKPDYSTANAAIKREWAYLRRICKRYGFGRHQLQPMREDAEALGRYLGGYLQKDWVFRLPEDKGARCVRYFGHWSKLPRKEKERRKSPPSNGRFGWLTPRSRAWREMVKQVVMVLRFKGAKISEANIKDLLGRRWAWQMGKLFAAVRFEADHLPDETTRAAIAEHNFKVESRWLVDGGNPAKNCWWHVTELTLDHLRPAPAWQKQMADLQLAKEVEAEIRKRLKKQRKEKLQAELKLEMLKEAAIEWGWIPDANEPF